MLKFIQDIKFKDICISGISGSSAVVVQAYLITWAQNLIRKQRATNHRLFECASRVIKRQGFRSLFKGTFSLFCYNSIARFGDVSSNFIVLNAFKKNSLISNTPIFIQSWFSWFFATIYRVCITPFQIYANPYNFRSIRHNNRRFVYLRAYKKQIKPQILALYSWFLVQNYLIEYTQKTTYAEGYLNAWTKYIWIGFLSMISYDCYKRAKNWILSRKTVSKFWFNRVCLRGVNGSIFCSTSRFIRQHISQ